MCARPDEQKPLKALRSGDLQSLFSHPSFARLSSDPSGIWTAHSRKSKWPIGTTEATYDTPQSPRQLRETCPHCSVDLTRSTGDLTKCQHHASCPLEATCPSLERTAVATQTSFRNDGMKYQNTSVRHTKNSIKQLQNISESFTNPGISAFKSTKKKEQKANTGTMKTFSMKSAIAPLSPDHQQQQPPPEDFRDKSNEPPQAAVAVQQIDSLAHWSPTLVSRRSRRDGSFGPPALSTTAELSTKRTYRRSRPYAREVFSTSTASGKESLCRESSFTSVECQPSESFSSRRMPSPTSFRNPYKIPSLSSSRGQSSSRQSRKKQRQNSIVQQHLMTSDTDNLNTPRNSSRNNSNKTVAVAAAGNLSSNPTAENQHHLISRLSPTSIYSDSSLDGGAIYNSLRQLVIDNSNTSKQLTIIQL